MQVRFVASDRRVACDHVENRLLNSPRIFQVYHAGLLQEFQAALAIAWPRMYVHFIILNSFSNYYIFRYFL